jgi:N6-L-threonylcarbamoyladenine synthase
MSVRVLGIETSCDETAAAVVEDGRYYLSNVVASQIEIHARYGGVFPEVASRQHVLAIVPVIEEALRQAHVSLKELDAIAVTRGPGLVGSLVVGLNTAKAMALASGLPLLGVNHLEGHVYSAWLAPADGGQAVPQPQFPLIALIVSGGHSELVLMQDHLTYQRLGGTVDDAAGEAFDKVARLLGLSYPGGPSIEKAAVGGNPHAFHFTRARLDGRWDFSFSGIKTAVLREVRRLEEADQTVPVADLAASFQEAVTDMLVSKTLQAARSFHVKQILVVGGVSANKSLRQAVLDQQEFPVAIPAMAFCTDNGAMIAVAGTHHFERGERDAFDMDVRPNWLLFSNEEQAGRPRPAQATSGSITPKVPSVRL